MRSPAVFVVFFDGGAHAFGKLRRKVGVFSDICEVLPGVFQSEIGGKIDLEEGFFHTRDDAEARNAAVFVRPERHFDIAEHIARQCTAVEGEHPLPALFQILIAAQDISCLRAEIARLLAPVLLGRNIGKHVRHGIAHIEHKDELFHDGLAEHRKRHRAIQCFPARHAAHIDHIALKGEIERRAVDEIDNKFQIVILKAHIEGDLPVLVDGDRERLQSDLIIFDGDLKPEIERSIHLNAPVDKEGAVEQDVVRALRCSADELLFRCLMRRRLGKRGKERTDARHFILPDERIFRRLFGQSGHRIARQ